MRVLIEMLKKCRLLSFPLLSTIWVSLEVSIKKWYCKGKKLFLTCRCVDKRERKLTVGNKLADSTTIHLTWLMFPDSYFYRDCAQEVVKKGALSCNSRAASANMLELILTLSYIQVAFYSSSVFIIYLLIWCSHQVSEVGIIFKMRKLKVREVKWLV